MKRFGGRSTKAPKRRHFMLAAAASLASRPILAQAKAPRRIVILMSLDEDHAEAEQRTDAMRQRLQELGWLEGGNIHVDYRWGAPNLEAIDAQTVELLAANPDVVVSTGTEATRAVMKANRTTSVVFVLVVDPVAEGIVPNLARPGGIVTGFSGFDSSMGGKWLQVLKQCVPGLSRVAALAHPDLFPVEVFHKWIVPSAGALGLDIALSPVRGVADVDAVAASYGRQSNGGLLILPDAFTVSNGQAILEAAARGRLPAIYPYRFFAASGGLISYGIDVPDLYRRSADYVARILGGAKAGDLPVQNPAKFELVFNLKTAKTLGITAPASLLAAADDVIE